MPSSEITRWEVALNGSRPVMETTPIGLYVAVEDYTSRLLQAERERDEERHEAAETIDALQRRLEKIRIALGPDGVAADVGAARLALTQPDTESLGEGEQPDGDQVVVTLSRRAAESVIDACDYRAGNIENDDATTVGFEVIAELFRIALDSTPKNPEESR